MAEMSWLAHKKRVRRDGRTAYLYQVASLSGLDVTDCGSGPDDPDERDLVIVTPAGLRAIVTTYVRVNPERPDDPPLIAEDDEARRDSQTAAVQARHRIRLSDLTTEQTERIIALLSLIERDRDTGDHDSGDDPDGSNELAT